MNKNLYKLFYRDYYSQVNFSYLFSNNREVIENNQAQIAAKNEELLGATLAIIPECKRTSPSTDTGAISRSDNGFRHYT